MLNKLASEENLHKKVAKWASYAVEKEKYLL